MIPARIYPNTSRAVGGGVTCGRVAGVTAARVGGVTAARVAGYPVFRIPAAIPFTVMTNASRSVGSGFER